mgnify:FL=1
MKRFWLRSTPERNIDAKMNNYKTMNIKLLIIFIFTILLTGCANNKESATDNQQIKTTKTSNINKGDYIVNKDLSTIKWTGKEITTKSHYGILDLKEGSIYVNNDGIISGKVVIDMNSINCLDMSGRGKNRLEGHLRSDDFFGVNSYPEANLIFTSWSVNNLGKILYKGDLTIKNITHPITFSGSVKKIDIGYRSTINLSFDRTLYEIKFRSGKYFQNLGDKLILDNIDITAEIVTY